MTARVSGHARMRIGLLVGWGIAAGALVYAFLSHRDVLQTGLAHAAASSLIAASAAYLALGCLRGFTLIPSTTLVLAAMPFFPPWPLFALTLAGIVISSWCIYVFAGALHLEEVFTGRHARTIERLRRALERHELPIIIGWSFFPLAPTDLVCYVCGAARVNLWKCLLGVAIGEGAICGLYIALGAQALH